MQLHAKCHYPELSCLLCPGSAWGSEGDDDSSEGRCVAVSILVALLFRLAAT